MKGMLVSVLAGLVLTGFTQVNTTAAPTPQLNCFKCKWVTGPGGTCRLCVSASSGYFACSCTACCAAPYDCMETGPGC